MPREEYKAALSDAVKAYKGKSNFCAGRIDRTPDDLRAIINDDRHQSDLELYLVFDREVKRICPKKGWFGPPALVKAVRVVHKDPRFSVDRLLADHEQTMQEASGLNMEVLRLRGTIDQLSGELTGAKGALERKNKLLTEQAGIIRGKLVNVANTSTASFPAATRGDSARVRRR